MQSSASSSNNKLPNKMQQQQQHTNKNSSLKTKSTTVINLNGPNASKDLETSLEIEKISKKISEHADALYRTWKSHGLAPTEILELYNVDAGVAAGAIADDKSTEDLQKLVNTFVNKDKEQRGVKTAVQKIKLAASGNKTETKPKIIEHKINSSSSGTKMATPSLNAQNNNSNNNTTAPHLSETKKSTPTSLKSTNFVIKNSLQGDEPDGAARNPSLTSSNVGSGKVTKLKANKQGIGGGGGGQLTNCSNQTPTTTTNHRLEGAKPLTSPSKQLDIDIDINLNLGINLDVHKLSQRQTENLQKIKQLLNKEPQRPAAKTPINSVPSTSGTTKIPAITQDLSSAKLVKEVKLKKPAANATANATATSLAAAAAAEKHKQTEETPVQKKTANDAVVTKKLGSKLKTSDTTLQTINKAHDFNQSIDSKEDKPKSNDNNRDGHIVTTATTTTTTTLQPQVAKKRTNLANNDEGSSSTTNKIANGIATPPSDDTKSPSNAIDISEGSTTKSPKTSTKSAKTTKLKEKTLSKNDNSKDPLTGNTSNNNNNTSAAVPTLLNGEKTPQQQLPQQQSQQQKSSSAATAVAATAAAETATAVESDSKTMEAQRSSNSSSTMPTTPTKLKSTRPLSNGQEKSLRSPFLTRGSVAERVMIFEKCPDVRNSFLNIKRPDRADAPPRSLLKVKLHATPPPPVEQNLIQKELKNTKSVYIPRFYFPHGKPQPTIALERTLRGILSAFDTFPNNQVTKDELPRILKICGLPFYWRMPVMVFCQQQNSGLVERQRFVEFWKQMNVYCHDNASRFVYILSRGQRMRSYILPEDLAPLVQDVVDTHPGLAFLKEATEFHSRYVHTVIARIFYSVNRSWSGKISISELKKSDLLEIITLLEEEDDINQIMAFFSYEHFYVIYCKFWELDKDHDLLINQDDLARHSDHALSTRIVERIFSGCVTRSDNKKRADDEPKMSYTDFVWFLLSEEDKRTPTAIEYWFRCMDIDGDGLLSMYELEYFYEEQQQRMESIGIESLPFEDCLCQMLDMIKPRRRDAITLGDLKNCKMTHVFFDTFFNLEKYLDHEQRDPFASQRDEYSTDWDRFAAQEYELLITEENE